MDIAGAMNSANYGMNRASEQVSQASAEIATAPGRIQQQQQDIAPTGAQQATETASETSQSVNSSNSLSESMLNQTVGERMFQANGKVLETAEGMLGSLIDVRA